MNLAANIGGLRWQIPLSLGLGTARPEAKLFLLGLSYKTAPVEVRERLAVHPSRLGCAGCRLRLAADLSELVLVSTCNRVEVYGVTGRITREIHRLLEVLAPRGTDLEPHLYFKQGEAAVRHLFSVAAGLDSMVLGETEITGQIKQAYLVAQRAKLTGRITNRLFQMALQTAKEIRTRTNIGRGATSVGSVAVELADRIFDRDLSTRSVMIIGAGKMGEACIRHLSKRGARSVLVSNRSYDRAKLLASEFNGRALHLHECLDGMIEADIVVSSTGCPETILSRSEVESVMRRRGKRPLVLIDIAVPRDIDPATQSLEDVYLYNVDHLENIVRENLKHRESELARCEGIISKYTGEMMARLVPTETRRLEPAWLPSPAACPT